MKEIINLTTVIPKNYKRFEDIIFNGGTDEEKVIDALCKVISPPAPPCDQLNNNLKREK